MSDRVNFTTGQFQEGEVTYYAILTDDFTDGFVIGDLDDAKAVLAALARLIGQGHADEEIYEFDERLRHEWLTVTNASERWGISERTISYACSQGHIKHVEMQGGRYRFRQNAFLAWKNNRPKPGPKPQTEPPTEYTPIADSIDMRSPEWHEDDEDEHDFSHSGLGISGLTRHVEEPVIPTLERLRELEAEKTRYVKCDCGHSIAPGLVMSTSNGSSCPDCYDRMEDMF